MTGPLTQRLALRGITSLATGKRPELSTLIAAHVAVAVPSMRKVA